jgi:hypothetical protein
METLEQTACPNCDSLSVAAYCPACGQKRPAPSDLSAARFLGEVVEALTNTESKVLRTTKALLLAPGRLTLDFYEGRRQRYLKPIQVFVACNVWFFLMQSVTGFNTFTTPLSIQANGLPYSRFVKGRILEILGESKLREAAFAAKFDGISGDLAKTLVFTMLPMFALVLLFLLARKRKFSYGQHLIFATHFFSFLMIFLPVVQLGQVWLRLPDLDLVLAAGFAVYAFVSIWRAYEVTRLQAFGLSVLAFVGFGIVLMSYRFLLLVATLLVGFRGWL